MANGAPQQKEDCFPTQAERHQAQAERHPNTYNLNPLVLPGPAAVVWLTGLPSSGKSTIAEALTKLIIETGFNAVWWDGDEVRRNLCRDLGYTKKDRDENIRRVGWLAKETVKQGFLTVVSVVSPYAKARTEARRMVEQVGGKFVEVFVRCPLIVCQERDVKGLYEKAARGEIVGMTGLDDPYQVPESPDVVCNTHYEEVRESVWQVYMHIRKEVWGNKNVPKMLDEGEN